MKRLQVQHNISVRLCAIQRLITLKQKAQFIVLVTDYVPKISF